MSKKPISFEKEQVYREAFLARLNSHRLSTPTSEWPTVRCWTEPALKKIFRQVRDELTAEGLESRLSHDSLLEWLYRLCLAATVPVDGASIHLLEIGANANSEVDPLELLMAAKPSGVVCFFSAVVFHGLTTQLVEHHHVAELQSDIVEKEKEEQPENDVAEQIERPTSNVSPRPRGIGKLLFHFQGTPFYSTRRSARLVPGVQKRNYGPRTQICITTLEQTLLDTLYKPFHCGGPEVVFDAWRECVASNRIDEERLISYLRSMNYPATARRLAVIMELVDASPGAELRKILDVCKESMDRQNPHARISLLPGVEYQTLNEQWLVNTP